MRQEMTVNAPFFTTELLFKHAKNELHTWKGCANHELLVTRRKENLKLKKDLS